MNVPKYYTAMGTNVQLSLFFEMQNNWIMSSLMGLPA